MIRSSLCKPLVGFCSDIFEMAKAYLLLLGFAFLFGRPVHYPSKRLFIVPRGVVVTRSRVSGFSHAMLSGGAWFYGGYSIRVVDLNRRIG